MSEDLLRALLGVKHELGELRGLAEATLREVQRTNGRVTALEHAVAGLESREEATRARVQEANQRARISHGRHERWTGWLQTAALFAAVIVSALLLALTGH